MGASRPRCMLCFGGGFEGRGEVGEEEGLKEVHEVPQRGYLKEGTTRWSLR